MTNPNERILKRVPLCGYPFFSDVYLTRRLIEWRLGEFKSTAVNKFPEDEIDLVFLDVETTGLNPKEHEIIELGMVKAKYSPSLGFITRVVDSISIYNEPSEPISDEITKITGITNDMVKGHRIRWPCHRLAIEDAYSEVSAVFPMFLVDDPVVIAHNANFDRKFIQKYMGGEDDYRWVCSIKDVDWTEQGYGTKVLDYLLFKHGYFFDAHRAETDCQALAWLLIENNKALTQCYKVAQLQTVTIRANGAPFDVKDKLKDRGYRWHSGDRVWSITVPDEGMRVNDEFDFLDKLYFRGSSKATHVTETARQRYK